MTTTTRPRTVRASIRVGDRDRSYVHVVPAEPRPGAPLIVALHGDLQTGAGLRKASGGTLDALAARVGADLVYLDAHRRSWNDGRIHLRSTAARRGIDDVGFVHAVIERFDRPALVVGYSNGGQMLHRLVRTSHGMLVGAAFIAAGLSVPEDFSLADVEPEPVPVLLFQGTADRVMPAAGGRTSLVGPTRGAVLSALDTAASYAGAPVSDAVVTEAVGSTRYDWDDRVRLILQTGAGHVVPNRVSRPWFIGPSHRDLDAGDEIADFFHL